MTLEPYTTLFLAILGALYTAVFLGAVGAIGYLFRTNARTESHLRVVARDLQTVQDHLRRLAGEGNLHDLPRTLFDDHEESGEPGVETDG